MTGPVLHSPIGLIAGSGSFPVEFVQNARARGLEVVVLAHVGEASPELEGLAGRCVWIKIGQLGKIIEVLRSAGVTQAAFAGGLRRVRLFGGIKFDLTGLAMMSRLSSFKDDAVLRGAAEELERHGISVIAASLLLEKSVPRAGVLTRRSLSAAEAADALVGFEAARALGRLDIGQTVAAHQGVVTAVEAVEGTDAALARAGEVTRGAGGVVVKLCKPQQDVRFDLPTIGVTTIERMSAARLTALVIEAEKSIVLDPLEVVRRADQAKIALVAVREKEDLCAPRGDRRVIAH